MYIITMLCAKGGVGKTTTSFTIAAGLAARGKNVLLLDADGQAHSTLLSKHKPRPGLYDLLVRGAEWAQCVLPVDPALLAPDAITGSLTLLPGNHETMVIPLQISDYNALRARLDEVSSVFDVVIIDTSPTPSLLNGSILLATDGVIFPAEMEYLGIQALRSSLRDVENFGKVRQNAGTTPIRVLGIVPTMYRAGTVEHQENLKWVSDQYGAAVWPALGQRITWPEAANHQQSIFVYAPNSPAADEGWRLVDLTWKAIYEQA